MTLSETRSMPSPTVFLCGLEMNKDLLDCVIVVGLSRFFDFAVELDANPVILIVSD